MIRRFLFILTGILLYLPSLHAQEEYVRFKRITINDGLSLSSVYNIYQDSKGFMWFGTEDGLNKYDGQSITVYGATTDQHYILANKWIEQVYEDKSGMIWLGSRGGLTKYNPRKGVFTTLQHDPASIFSLSNDTVSAIIADLRNDVWVGTFGGLNRVNRITSEVERIEPEEEELFGLTTRITGFLQDPSGVLWIATYRGLFSYDRKSGLFFKESADGLIDGRTTIFTMNHGTEAIWLGTSKGLVKIDLSGAKEHLHIPPQFEDPGTEIVALLEDRLGQVWIQTGEGLFCYKVQEGSLQKILMAGRASNSQATNPVEPLVDDRNGDIWHGSFGDGVYQIDP
ncbi:MAG: hypothetical protein KAT15_28665, partial [Bacteroidales bacterium]|nr:hypothetical protein [Bacteroidales bacterium]